jgi:uncharacterized membrane protein HdeD (DUF308 family)
MFSLRPSGNSPFGASSLMMGLLLTAFGFAVLINPALLNNLIAIFFIVSGIWFLNLWWKTRK